MDRLKRFTTILVFGLCGLLYTQLASAQQDIQPSYGPQTLGKVIEKDCDYLVKTQRSRQNLCQLIAASRTGNSENLEVVASCLQAASFKAYKKAYFVEFESKEMTLTKSYIKSSGNDFSCELELARVFDHFKVEDDGRLVKVPGHWRAVSIVCE